MGNRRADRGRDTGAAEGKSLSPGQGRVGDLRDGNVCAVLNPATDRSGSGRADRVYQQIIGMVSHKHHLSYQCRKRCFDEEDHFEAWKSCYMPYLREMFGMVLAKTYSARKVHGAQRLKITLSDFVEFAYQQSSGYISEFA